MRAGPSVVVALMLASGAARADDHREGEYGGVTPGQTQAAADAAAAKDHKRPKRPPPKDELTWIGFQSKDGGGELFFQAPASFTVAQWIDKGQVVLVLEGLHRQVRNTRRPLDTRYFDAPIARVTARPVGAHGGGGSAHKAGIEVRIAFKNPKDAHAASVRTATEADGMFYAYLDFTGGTTATPKDDDEPAPGNGKRKGSGAGSDDSDQ